MNVSIQSCCSIDELHRIWKKHQLTEAAKYLPANIPPYSFLPDGIISYEKFANASRKILFVGKEAYWFYPNGTLGENQEYAKEENLYFWHQKVAFGEDGVKESIFSKRLSMLTNAINTGDFKTVNKNHVCLQSVAFINLNKRGGYNYCVWETLAGYVEQYAEFIAKEITLINPDLIICCGHDVKWLIDKYVAQYLTDGIPMIALHHPSYFVLKDEKYLQELQCALQNQQWVYEDVKVDDSATKGIIFDTNKTYSVGALYDMLTGRKISAYEAASRFIDSFNIGDYAFYYVKGRGIVAAGKVISEKAISGEFEGDSEKFKMVDIIVPQQIPFSEDHLCALSPSALKDLLGHGFYYAATTKRPYLDKNECVKVVRALKDLYSES